MEHKLHLESVAAPVQVREELVVGVGRAVLEKVHLERELR
jgi:hypothetical protein